MLQFISIYDVRLCFYFAVGHTLRDLSRCVGHSRVISRYGCIRHMARYRRYIAHRLSAIDVGHTPRDLWWCVGHSQVISRSDTCVRHILRDVTDITRPRMWCMPPLYFLQHSTSASPSLSYNLINIPASYYSKQGVSCTEGNGTGSWLLVQFSWWSWPVFCKNVAILLLPSTLPEK